MSQYATTYPLVPYDALQNGAVVIDVQGVAINWFTNRTPLFATLNKLPIGSPTFLITNDNYRPRSVNLSGNYTTGSSTTLTFTDASELDVGDVLQVDSELFLVTATSATAPTVTGAYAGTTGANHATGTPAYLITNTRSGADIEIQGLSRNPATVTQSVQTIMHAYRVGGSLAATQNYVSGLGSAVNRERMLAMQHCMDDMESGMYYGTLVKYSASPGAKAMQAGLANLILTNRTLNPVNKAAYKPSDLARDTFQAIMANGGNPSKLLVSTDWLSGLMTWGSAITRIDAGTTVLGTPITRYRAPFLNDIEIVPAPLMRTGSCLCLSEPEVKVRMMRNLFEKARGSRGDATEGDFIMEGAVELDNEAHHAYVTGITGFAAS